MAVSTGKKGSKLDFSKSILNTVSMSSDPGKEETAPKHTPLTEKKEEPVNNVNKINYENNVNNVNNAVKAESYAYEPYAKPIPTQNAVNMVALKEEIEIPRLRKNEPDKRAVTFSVSYIKDGNLEKIVRAASQKFGYSKSLYVRNLIYADYMAHKEEYDELIKKL